jgi:hypothetical protein
MGQRKTGKGEVKLMNWVPEFYPINIIMYHLYARYIEL